MLVLVDLLLLLGLTLRLTRLITTDKITQEIRTRASYTDFYSDLLNCPFCIGFWIGVAALLSLALVGGPGDAPDWWRYIAGAFTMSYLVGHIAARLD